jgi:hypothetical protein
VILLFLLSAAFLVTILFIGTLNSHDILVAKPKLIATAGIRRTINAAIVFWQREHFLETRESSMAYKAMLPKARYYYDTYEAWERCEGCMYEAEKRLLDMDAVLSETHYNLLFENA